MAYVIPRNEYFERIAKFQERIKAAKLDACLVHGTESDFANVRYLSEYWPTFEQAGVFASTLKEYSTDPIRAITNSAIFGLDTDIASRVTVSE